MSRPIVGVTANLCPVDKEGKNIHSSVSSKFAESIRIAGGLPMIIPVGDKNLVRDYVESIDKLILSGGQHVHPTFYGEKQTIESDDYNMVRDEFELALLAETIRQEKPIMAICRGLQLVNVAFDPRDKTIEAIESLDDSRIIGLQWHPEFLVNEEKGNLELFQYLLQKL